MSSRNLRSSNQPVREAWSAPNSRDKRTTLASSNQMTSHITAPRRQAPLSFKICSKSVQNITKSTSSMATSQERNRVAKESISAATSLHKQSGQQRDWVKNNYFSKMSGDSGKSAHGYGDTKLNDFGPGGEFENAISMFDPNVHPHMAKPKVSLIKNFENRNDEDCTTQMRCSTVPINECSFSSGSCHKPPESSKSILEKIRDFTWSESNYTPSDSFKSEISNILKDYHLPKKEESIKQKYKNVLRNSSIPKDTDPGRHTEALRDSDSTENDQGDCRSKNNISCFGHDSQTNDLSEMASEGLMEYKRLKNHVIDLQEKMRSHIEKSVFSNNVLNPHKFGHLMAYESKSRTPYTLSNTTPQHKECDLKTVGDEELYSTFKGYIQKRNNTNITDRHIEENPNATCSNADTDVRSAYEDSHFNDKRSFPDESTRSHPDRSLGQSKDNGLNTSRNEGPQDDPTPYSQGQTLNRMLARIMPMRECSSGNNSERNLIIDSILRHGGAFVPEREHQSASSSLFSVGPNGTDDSVYANGEYNVWTEEVPRRYSDRKYMADKKFMADNIRQYRLRTKSNVKDVSKQNQQMITTLFGAAPKVLIPKGQQRPRRWGLCPQTLPGKPQLPPKTKRNLDSYSADSDFCLDREDRAAILGPGYLANSRNRGVSKSDANVGLNMNCNSNRTHDMSAHMKGKVTRDRMFHNSGRNVNRNKQTIYPVKENKQTIYPVKENKQTIYSVKERSASPQKPTKRAERPITQPKPASPNMPRSRSRSVSPMVIDEGKGTGRMYKMFEYIKDSVPNRIPVTLKLMGKRDVTPPSIATSSQVDRPTPARRDDARKASRHHPYDESKNRKRAATDKVPTARETKLATRQDHTSPVALTMLNRPYNARSTPANATQKDGSMQNRIAQAAKTYVNTKQMLRSFESPEMKHPNWYSPNKYTNTNRDAPSNKKVISNKNTRNETSGFKQASNGNKQQNKSMAELDFKKRHALIQDIKQRETSVKKNLVVVSGGKRIDLSKKLELKKSTTKKELIDCKEPTIYPPHKETVSNQSPSKHSALPTKSKDIKYGGRTIHLDPHLKSRSSKDDNVVIENHEKADNYIHRGNSPRQSKSATSTGAKKSKSLQSIRDNAKNSKTEPKKDSRERIIYPTTQPARRVKHPHSSDPHNVAERSSLPRPDSQSVCVETPQSMVTAKSSPTKPAKSQKVDNFKRVEKVPGARSHSPDFSKNKRLFRGQSKSQELRCENKRITSPSIVPTSEYEYDKSRGEHAKQIQDSRNLPDAKISRSDPVEKVVEHSLPTILESSFENETIESFSREQVDAQGGNGDESTKPAPSEYLIFGDSDESPELPNNRGVSPGRDLDEHADTVDVFPKHQTSLTESISAADSAFGSSVDPVDSSSRIFWSKDNNAGGDTQVATSKNKLNEEADGFPESVIIDAIIKNQHSCVDGITAPSLTPSSPEQDAINASILQGLKTDVPNIETFTAESLVDSKGQLTCPTPETVAMKASILRSTSLTAAPEDPNRPGSRSPSITRRPLTLAKNTFLKRKSEPASQKPPVFQSMTQKKAVESELPVKVKPEASSTACGILTSKRVYDTGEHHVFIDVQSGKVEFAQNTLEGEGSTEMETLERQVSTVVETLGGERSPDVNILEGQCSTELDSLEGHESETKSAASPVHGNKTAEEGVEVSKSGSSVSLALKSAGGAIKSAGSYITDNVSSLKTAVGSALHKSKEDNVGGGEQCSASKSDDDVESEMAVQNEITVDNDNTGEDEEEAEVGVDIEENVDVSSSSSSVSLKLKSAGKAIRSAGSYISHNVSSIKTAVGSALHKSKGDAQTADTDLSTLTQVADRKEDQDKVVAITKDAGDSDTHRAEPTPDKDIDVSSSSSSVSLKLKSAGHALRSAGSYISQNVSSMKSAVGSALHKSREQKHESKLNESALAGNEESDSDLDDSESDVESSSGEENENEEAEIEDIQSDLKQTTHTPKGNVQVTHTMHTPKTNTRLTNDDNAELGLHTLKEDNILASKGYATPRPLADADTHAGIETDNEAPAEAPKDDTQVKHNMHTPQVVKYDESGSVRDDESDSESSVSDSDIDPFSCSEEDDNDETDKCHIPEATLDLDTMAKTLSPPVKLLSKDEDHPLSGRHYITPTPVTVRGQGVCEDHVNDGVKASSLDGRDTSCSTKMRTQKPGYVVTGAVRKLVNSTASSASSTLRSAGDAISNLGHRMSHFGRAAKEEDGESKPQNVEANLSKPVRIGSGKVNLAVANEVVDTLTETLFSQVSNVKSGVSSASNTISTVGAQLGETITEIEKVTKEEAAEFVQGAVISSASSASLVLSSTSDAISDFGVQFGDRLAATKDEAAEVAGAVQEALQSGVTTATEALKYVGETVADERCRAYLSSSSSESQRAKQEPSETDVFPEDVAETADPAETDSDTGLVSSLSSASMHMIASSASKSAGDALRSAGSYISGNVSSLKSAVGSALHEQRYETDSTRKDFRSSVPLGNCYEVIDERKGREMNTESKSNEMPDPPQKPFSETRRIKTKQHSPNLDTIMGIVCPAPVNHYMHTPKTSLTSNYMSRNTPVVAQKNETDADVQMSKPDVVNTPIKPEPESEDSETDIEGSSASSSDGDASGEECESVKIEATIAEKATSLLARRVSENRLGHGDSDNTGVVKDKSADSPGDGTKRQDGNSNVEESDSSDSDSELGSSSASSSEEESFSKMKFLKEKLKSVRRKVIEIESSASNSKLKTPTALASSSAGSTSGSDCSSGSGSDDSWSDSSRDSSPDFLSSAVEVMNYSHQSKTPSWKRKTPVKKNASFRSASASSASSASSDDEREKTPEKQSSVPKRKVNDDVSTVVEKKQVTPAAKTSSSVAKEPSGSSSSDSNRAERKRIRKRDRIKGALQYAKDNAIVPSLQYAKDNAIVPSLQYAKDNAILPSFQYAKDNAIVPSFQYAKDTITSYVAALPLTMRQTSHKRPLADKQNLQTRSQSPTKPTCRPTTPVKDSARSKSKSPIIHHVQVNDFKDIIHTPKSQVQISRTPSPKAAYTLNDDQVNDLKQAMRSHNIVLQNNQEETPIPRKLKKLAESTPRFRFNPPTNSQMVLDSYKIPPIKGEEKIKQNNSLVTKDLDLPVDGDISVVRGKSSENIKITPSFSRVAKDKVTLSISPTSDSSSDSSDISRSSSESSAISKPTSQTSLKSACESPVISKPTSQTSLKSSSEISMIPKPTSQTSLKSASETSIISKPLSKSKLPSPERLGKDSKHQNKNAFLYQWKEDTAIIGKSDGHDKKSLMPFLVKLGRTVTDALTHQIDNLERRYGHGEADIDYEPYQSRHFEKNKEPPASGDDAATPRFPSYADKYNSSSSGRSSPDYTINHRNIPNVVRAEDSKSSTRLENMEYQHYKHETMLDRLKKKGEHLLYDVIVQKREPTSQAYKSGQSPPTKPVKPLMNENLVDSGPEVDTIKVNPSVDETCIEIRISRSKENVTQPKSYTLGQDKTAKIVEHTHGKNTRNGVEENPENETQATNGNKSWFILPTFWTKEKQEPAKIVSEASPNPTVQPAPSLVVDINIHADAKQTEVKPSNKLATLQNVKDLFQYDEQGHPKKELFGFRRGLRRVKREIDRFSSADSNSSDSEDESVRRQVTRPTKVNHLPERSSVLGRPDASPSSTETNFRVDVKVKDSENKVVKAFSPKINPFVSEMSHNPRQQPTLKTLSGDDISNHPSVQQVSRNFDHTGVTDRNVENNLRGLLQAIDNLELEIDQSFMKPMIELNCISRPSSPLMSLSEILSAQQGEKRDDEENDEEEDWADDEPEYESHILRPSMVEDISSGSEGSVSRGRRYLSKENSDSDWYSGSKPNGGQSYRQVTARSSEASYFSQRSDLDLGGLEPTHEGVVVAAGHETPDYDSEEGPVYLFDTEDEDFETGDWSMNVISCGNKLADDGSGRSGSTCFQDGGSGDEKAMLNYNRARYDSMKTFGNPANREQETGMAYKHLGESYAFGPKNIFERAMEAQRSQDRFASLFSDSTLGIFSRPYAQHCSNSIDFTIDTSRR